VSSIKRGIWDISVPKGSGFVFVGFLAVTVLFAKSRQDQMSSGNTVVSHLWVLLGAK